MLRRVVVALCVSSAGCARFPDPAIVADLRVLAMKADVPEQILDVDLSNPPDADALLAQMVPATVCGLATDPVGDRQLRWSMQLCQQSLDDRCDAGTPAFDLGFGLLPAPDVTVPEPSLCATVAPDADLATVVLASLSADPLHGLQGEQYDVVMRVGGQYADPALDLFAAKALDVAARIPTNRSPNHNPYLDELDGAVAGALPVLMTFARCVDQPSPLQVPSGADVRLTPIEPPGIHEIYTIPLVDGTFETFTETITYQWTARAGSFTLETSGGVPDEFGNAPPIYTDWTAPTVNTVTDESLWVVQRDERLGVAWYEMCLQVMP